MITGVMNPALLQVIVTIAMIKTIKKKGYNTFFHLIITCMLFHPFVGVDTTITLFSPFTFPQQ